MSDNATNKSTPQSASAPEAPPTSAAMPTQPEAKVQRPSMPIKDRISLITSLLALLISSMTFILNRVEKYKEAHTTNSRNLYSAFQVGERFATSFVVYHQARAGSPESITNATSSALKYARLAQGYADRLNIGVDLRTIIEEYKPGKEIIPEPVTTIIEERLIAEQGKLASEHFALGFWLAWWIMNLGIADSGTTPGNRAMLESLTKQYPDLRDSVIAHLRKARISVQLPEAMPAPTDLLKLLAEIRKAAESGLRERTRA